MATTPSTDWLRRQAALLFSAVVFGYLLLGSVKLIIENYRVHESTKRLSSEVAQIEQRNLELENLLAYYRTDSYKEKVARARFNYQRPGERVVVVPQPVDEEPSITQPSVETKPETPASNPQLWMDYFFGNRG